MRQKVMLVAAFAVAMLSTTHNVEAETAEEVVQKIRQGLSAGGEIEFSLAEISFPGISKPGKELILAKSVEVPGTPSPMRTDFLTPESEEGDPENGNAYVGLRYLTMIQPDETLAVGTLWRNSKRKTSKIVPYPDKRVRPDLPIPFLYLNLEDYLLRYKEWEMGDGMVSTLQAGRGGNPWSLPRLRIKFFRQKAACLISELYIEGGSKFKLAFEGYEEQDGMFRPTTITATEGGDTAVVFLRAIWFRPKAEYQTAVFTSAGFGEMLNLANIGGGEIVERR